MKSKTELMLAPDVTRLIHSVRDQRVILDADLAGLYDVPTKRLTSSTAAISTASRKISPSGSRQTNGPL